MKTRIISALVGLIILGVAIAFYDTIIFNLFSTCLLYTSQSPRDFL